VNEIRVESWTQLQGELFAGSWNEPLGRHRSSLAFRGRADAADDLRTSLDRLGGDAAELERHIARAFRKYAEADAVPADSVWNWLTLGQHHGLPTRLLDWTFSPYVALHFVTAELSAFDRDGAIWCVDFTRVHAEVPNALREQLLDRVVGDLRSLAALGDFPVFVEPPSFDARIVNQYALFSLMSRSEGSLDRWLDAHLDAARRIVVPAALKWEARDKLDLANVTERVLFPGLDGLSRWLKRYYLPRDAA